MNGMYVGFPDIVTTKLHGWRPPRLAQIGHPPDGPVWSYVSLISAFKVGKTKGDRGAVFTALELLHRIPFSTFGNDFVSN